jgi:rhodanese-related sulfurtransferase
MSELTIEQAAALAPLVSPQEATVRVAAGAVLIDVRSAAGRANGLVPGAIAVAKDAVDARFAPGSSDPVAGVKSTATPIVVICGSVLGSGPVAEKLIAKGHTDVVQVEGGFPAWQEAGLPVE